MIPETTETQEIPEATNDDEAGSESVDGIPAATDDSEEAPEQTDENSDEELEQSEYQEELQPAESCRGTVLRYKESG